jgi:DNA (cytosine-5)-methyltransferase 1
MAGFLTYADVLSTAWRAATQPRAVDAPTVISLFAGCGGSSLGYAIAGYRELFAVEWGKQPSDTFKRNFPGVPVDVCDVRAVSAQRCLDVAQIRVGELDVLDGSPPCQGFSTSGKRRINDPRNTLFREYARLLGELQPKAFIMENVAGLLSMREVFADLLRALRAANYRVSARLLNAMYFNVPQSRPRVIFIGVRNDLAPEPTHPVAARYPLTVRQALTNLPLPDTSPPAAVSQHTRDLMRACTPGISLCASHKLKSYYSWIKADWNRPCKTLHKTVCFGGFLVWHPEEERGLTGREIARIGSWPDEFNFQGSFADWVADIGNSVPPLFMAALAAHVRTTVLAK